MKKKLSAFLTAVLCTTVIVSAVPVNAAELKQTKNDIYSNELFTYNTSNYTLDTETIDADFMVVGIRYGETDPEYKEYYITPINKPDCYITGGVGTLGTDLDGKNVEGFDMQIGDLLKFEGGFFVAETYPPIYAPLHDSEEGIVSSKVVYLGNGVDLLGEEFADVVRTQSAIEQADLIRTGINCDNIDWGGVTVHWGDANEDEEIDILDCITLNKNLLGSYDLTKYAGLIADVNMDGKLDSTDSLAILKEVVGLTVNYEPAVD